MQIGSAMLRRAPSSFSALDNSGGTNAARQDQYRPSMLIDHNDYRSSARMPDRRLQFAVVPKQQRALGDDAAACSRAAARAADESGPADRWKLVCDLSRRSVTRGHRS